MVVSEMVACGDRSGRRKVTGCCLLSSGILQLFRWRSWLGYWNWGEASGGDEVVQGGRSWWPKLLNREWERESDSLVLERETKETERKMQRWPREIEGERKGESPETRGMKILNFHVKFSFVFYALSVLFSIFYPLFRPLLSFPCMLLFIADKN